MRQTAIGRLERVLGGAGVVIKQVGLFTLPFPRALRGSCGAQGVPKFFVIHPQTSAGTQVHLHVSEQVLGGVAHELYTSEVPSTMALP